MNDNNRPAVIDSIRLRDFLKAIGQQRTQKMKIQDIDKIQDEFAKNVPQTPEQEAARIQIVLLCEIARSQYAMIGQLSMIADGINRVAAAPNAGGRPAILK